MGIKEPRIILSGDMHAGGLRADEQGPGDLRVGVPSGKEQQDLPLPVG
jgi:hypothetical protein